MGYPRSERITNRVGHRVAIRFRAAGAAHVGRFTLSVLEHLQHAAVWIRQPGRPAEDPRRQDRQVPDRAKHNRSLAGMRRLTGDRIVAVEDHDDVGIEELVGAKRGDVGIGRHLWFGQIGDAVFLLRGRPHLLQLIQSLFAIVSPLPTPLERGAAAEERNPDFAR